jgi:hypothetical protein
MINDIRIIGIPDALVSLRPGAQWLMNGMSYSDLVWQDENQTQPTELEVLTEVARLKQEYDNNLYQRQRAAEYPDFKQYLDGVVKGDQEQIQAYIDACQAVKAKYPKP